MGWTKQGSESDIKTIIELTPSQIYKYCLIKIIDATHLDIWKFHFAVGTLEALLSSTLTEDYFAEVKKKEDELKQIYKDFRIAEKEAFIFEVDKFKLSLLYVKLKENMPEEIELEISDAVEEKGENE